jgi:hypothetical protein
MSFRPTPFQPDHDRYFYEPRVFWSTGIGRASTATNRKLVFSQEHFRNGSRFPIRLTKLLVSPIGYLLRSFTGQTNAQYDACGAAIARSTVSIEYPRGFSGQRIAGPTTLVGAEPTAEPTMDSTAQEGASGMLGLSRWDFDLPYFVPQDYQVPLELSNIRLFQDALVPANVRANRAFFERTRSWILGHGVVNLDGLIQSSPTGDAFPQGPQPTGQPDAAIFATGAGNAPSGWSQGGGWPGGTWGRQKSNRGLPYSEVTGFGVHIDQRLLDDNIIAAVQALGIPDPRVAPIAQRIITKCRTVNAGTGERWWRDGAPLSLVSPTINSSAFVRELEDPIVLGPGEAVNVSIILPPSFALGEDTIDPIFSVGLSLAGYAVVEDNMRKIPPMPGELLPQPMI